MRSADFINGVTKSLNVRHTAGFGGNSDYDNMQLGIR